MASACRSNQIGTGLRIVDRLLKTFPGFRPEEILANLEIPESLSPALYAECEFIAKIAKPWTEEDEYDRDAAASVDLSHPVLLRREHVYYLIITVS